MCSIGDDDYGDEGGIHAMVPDIENVKYAEIEVLCNKCKNPSAVYKLPFREAECKECFLNYARHKFRATLGSSKILPKNAKVLLIFDGSAQAMVLLDMLHHAQTMNTFKRLHCSATILYIDDFQRSSEDADNNGYSEVIAKIQSILGLYNDFESYILPLVHVEAATTYISSFKTLSNEYFNTICYQKQEFLSSLADIKSLTSRQDYLKIHRSKLITAAARKFDCEFAFIANISSDLASDLLTAIALGRGGSASLDVALIDDRLGDGIQIVRPLKDLTEEEIRLYIKAQDLPLLPYQCLGEDIGDSGSLQNLTKKFVKDLQRNFSSTVSTVFRTGSKISSNQNVVSQIESLNLNDCCSDLPDVYCSFCKSVLDYKDSTTVLAIEFSRIVSEIGTTAESVNNLNEKAIQNVGGTNKKCHLKKLCHACRNIYAESSNKQLL